MKNDYEQMYYDLLYENKKLKNKIRILEDELKVVNVSRGKKNIELHKYILNSLNKYEEVKQK